MQPRDFLGNSLETPKISACLRSMSDCASFFYFVIAPGAHILSEGYHLLFPAAIPLRVWAVESMGYDNTVNEPTGSDK